MNRRISYLGSFVILNLNILPQFDFALLPKLLNFSCALLFFVAFFSLFFVALPYWLKAASRIAFSVVAINEIRWIATRLNSTMAALPLFFDVMEQFVFAPKFSFLLIFAIVAILSCFAVFFSPFLNYLYKFTAELAQNVLSDNKDFAQKTTNFLFVIFFSILYANFIGLIPGAFTFTSSLVIPGLLAFTIFFYWFTSLGFRFGFFSFAGLVPAGERNAITPLVTAIELISNLAKFVSLGIRLFANMFAGHLLLKVLYSAVFLVISFASVLSFCLGVLVIAFTIFIVALEAMIAFLQAYVFLLLTIIYIRDTKQFVGSH